MNPSPEEPSHLLPADRLARRREHLMNEITPTPQPAHPRRARRWAVIGGITALVAVGGGAALADGNPIWRQTDGSVAINPGLLRPAYEGRYLTEAELAALQSHGRASASANNEELACQGITLYFDTEAQRDAYNTDFDARYPSNSSRPTASPSADPCMAYTSAPRYVTNK
jgi:hypothetical protein